MDTITVKYQGFEILCKPATIEKYRKGVLGFDKVVITDDEIYTNVKRGEKAKGADLIKVFGSGDIRAGIEKMLMSGDYPLTSAERKGKLDLKRREILGIVHKSVMDPKSGLPHPMTRIEAVMEEVKFRVDVDKSGDRQAQDFMKKMIGVLPIKRMEPITAQIIVPHKFLGKVQGVIPGLVSNILKTDYTREGCIMEVSMLPNDLDKVTGTLNKMIQDNYQLEVTSGMGAAPKTAEENIAEGKVNKNNKSKHGKKKGKGKRGKN